MSQYKDLPADEANDWGGVHTNSGIHNKTAFLMADGQFFNGVNVRGFGKPKLALLAYKTLTSLPVAIVGSLASFAQARDTAYTIAKAMAKKGTLGFTDEDVCTVRNAYAATEIVPVGTADQDCDGAADQEDADDDGDLAPDSVDNCPIANPSQFDTDGDGVGDACDGDDDGDGRPDLVDNCPLVSNTNQFDSDNNGIGDACQDFDQDTIVDMNDNCLGVANTSQTDTDHDGKGNACDGDDDGDGVPDITDNCKTASNPDQKDSDGGGIGDACDPTPNDPTNDSIVHLNQQTRTKIDVKLGPNPPDPTRLVKLLVDLCAGGCVDGWVGDRRVHVHLTGLGDNVETWISMADGTRVASPIDRSNATAVFDFQGRGQGEYVINVAGERTQTAALGVAIQLRGKRQTLTVREQQ